MELAELGKIGAMGDRKLPEYRLQAGYCFLLYADHPMLAQEPAYGNSCNKIISICFSMNLYENAMVVLLIFVNLWWF